MAKARGKPEKQVPPPLARVTAPAPVDPAAPLPPSASDPVDELLAHGGYPGLYAAAHGPDGPRIREELVRVLYGNRKRRATRHKITRVARLKAGDYDEVVLVSEISTSGVRLLLQKDCPLDVNDAASLWLLVSTETGPRALPLELVRICENSGKHLDIAFRFVEPGPDKTLIASLRSLIFEPPWTATAAAGDH